MSSFPYKRECRHGRVTVYKSAKGKYRIRWFRGSKRLEEKTADRERAIRRADEIFEQLKLGETIQSQTTGDKVAYYIACEQMLEGATDLMTAVRFYIEQNAGGSNILVEAAIAAYLVSQGKNGHSKIHISNMTRYLRRFKVSFAGKLLRNLSVADVNGFLEQFPGLCNRQNFRLALVHFFKWSKAQGWLTQAMPTVAERSTMIKLKRKDPGILAPEDLDQVLRLAEAKKPALVPYLVLGAFAGIRAAEICRLKASDIKYEQGIISLSCEITKTNSPRTVKMPPNLVEWLRKYAPKEGLVAPMKLPDLMRATMMGKAPWVRNGLRHSFVTYMVQISRNVAEIAEQCGHSMYVNSAFYKGLSDPETARKWFGILPSPLTP